MRIGVLALQGDFAKHCAVLRALGVDAIEVRKPNGLDQCDGLIIPGGESTAMMKRLSFIKMREKLIDFGATKPLFGTCAGLIILSKKVQSAPFEPLQLFDITIERNAYGRQIESFCASVSLNLPTEKINQFPAYFIRAPRIQSCATNVMVLATHNSEPVLIRQGHLLGATFHPELTPNPLIHRYFIEMIRTKA